MMMMAITVKTRWQIQKTLNDLLDTLWIVPVPSIQVFD